MEAGVIVGAAEVCRSDPLKEQAVYGYRETQSTEIDLVNAMLIEEHGVDYPYPLRTIDPDGVYVTAFDQHTGEVVGFARAVPFKGHDGVYELGSLIVKRAHRNKGVGGQLLKLRLIGIRAKGAKAAVSEPVCYRSDCASQKNLISHKFVLLGIQPGKYPGIQTEILGGQPETVLMAARWLEGDSGFGTRKIFLPQAYRGMLHKFMPRYVHQRGFHQILPGTMPTPIFHTGRQGATGLGADFVDVPANWQQAEELMIELRAQGYRFSSVLPAFGVCEDGSPYDFIRMYRLPSEWQRRFDFQRVHVVPQLESLELFFVGEHIRTR